MDSDTLRIILLILGIMLVAGIYLWERQKMQRKRKSARAALVEEHVAEQQAADRMHGEYEFDDDVLSRHLEELETIVRKEEVVTEPLIDTELEEENIGNETPVPSEPEEILMLSVVSRRKYFTGDAIMSAMRSVGLNPGESDIFYRYTNDEQETLYAVASMVEPGFFPLADMSRFTTAGITLFASLPGPRPGKRIFEDMYETAEQLAAFLDGTIHDGHHNPITDESLEYMRDIADAYAD